MRTLYERLSLPVLLYDQDRNIRFDTLLDVLQGPNCQAVRITQTRGLSHFGRITEMLQALKRCWPELPS